MWHCPFRETLFELLDLAVLAIASRQKHAPPKPKCLPKEVRHNVTKLLIYRGKSHLLYFYFETCLSVLPYANSPLLPTTYLGIINQTKHQISELSFSSSLPRLYATRE
jgi:hypothetical protein